MWKIARSALLAGIAFEDTPAENNQYRGETTPDALLLKTPPVSAEVALGDCRSEGHMMVQQVSLDSNHAPPQRISARQSYVCHHIKLGPEEVLGEGGRFGICDIGDVDQWVGAYHAHDV